MTQKRTGAWDFGRAVLSAAWTYEACGTGAAILSIWGWATGRVPPTWLFFAVIAIGSLVGGFWTWKKQRADLNATVAELVNANAKLEELSRPRFLPEIPEVVIEGTLSDRTGYGSICLVIRNQGAESAIEVLPPQPATPYIGDEGSLSESRHGSGDKVGPATYRAIAK